MAYPSDTSPEAERLVIEGYRRMSPADKIARVVDITMLVAGVYERLDILTQRAALRR